MDTNHFWQIIENATRHDPAMAEDWDDQLVEQLVTLPADEILAWDRILSDLASRAYRNDLWAAAYLINGGASDDGFYYFRCWLVGMGRNVCMNALQDPDSLADVIDPHWLTDGIDAEAKIYAAGFRAWQTVTGAPDEAAYPHRQTKTQPYSPRKCIPATAQPPPQQQTQNRATTPQSNEPHPHPPRLSPLDP